MAGALAHITVPVTSTAAATSKVPRVPARRTTTDEPALPRMDATAYAVDAHA